jgi:hypothetical protein
VKSQKVKKMSEECLKVIGISFRLFYVKSYELRVLSHLPFIEWFYRLHVISSKLILLNEFADVTTSFDVTGGSSSLLYRWWWCHARPPSSLRAPTDAENKWMQQLSENNLARILASQFSRYREYPFFPWPIQDLEQDRQLGLCSGDAWCRFCRLLRQIDHKVQHR